MGQCLGNSCVEADNVLKKIINFALKNFFFCPLLSIKKSFMRNVILQVLQ